MYIYTHRERRFDSIRSIECVGHVRNGCNSAGFLFFFFALCSTFWLYFALCCRVLQSVAACFRVLQCVAVAKTHGIPYLWRSFSASPPLITGLFCESDLRRQGLLQCLGHGNTLQHTATHCITRHHTATHGNTMQHTAAHCNTLQHTAAHCITLHHTAAHCNTLQHIATHCITL